MAEIEPQPETEPQGGSVFRRVAAFAAGEEGMLSTERGWTEDEVGALRAGVDAALGVVRAGYETFGDEAALCLSFNGGKDCTVLLALVGAVWAERGGDDGARNGWTAAYLRSRNPFAEVEAFIAEAVAWAGIGLVEVAPQPGGMQAMLAALLELRPHTKAMWMGTRRGDPYADDLAPFAPTDPGWPSLVRISPILDWSYSLVWLFLAAFDIPFCSLYAAGYTSLGDVHNTLPNPLLRTVDPLTGAVAYAPAWTLADASTERDGRGCHTPPATT